MRVLLLFCGSTTILAVSLFLLQSGIMSPAFALLAPFGVDLDKTVCGLVSFSFTLEEFLFCSHLDLGIHAVYFPVSTLFIVFILSRGSVKFCKGHLFLPLHDHSSKLL